jgi:hypothetical protein
VRHVMRRRRLQRHGARRPAIHDFLAVCKDVDVAPPANSPGQASRTMTRREQPSRQMMRLFPRRL